MQSGKIEEEHCLFENNANDNVTDQKKKPAVINYRFQTFLFLLWFFSCPLIPPLLFGPAFLPPKFPSSIYRPYIPSIAVVGGRYGASDTSASSFSISFFFSNFSHGFELTVATKYLVRSTPVSCKDL